MVQDPRKFSGEFKCAKSARLQAQGQAAKSDALKGLKNVAGIETGTGVTDKLNSFVHLSDAGGPELNTFLNNGVNGTLSTLGMNPEYVNGTLSQLNPNAVNSGIGAIKSMHQRMSNGNLSFSNLPGYARDLNQLKTTYDNSLIKSSVDERIARECSASPYAMDLVNYSIKHKFMFVVEFVFNEPYHTGAIDTNQNIVATLVKQANRPNITYEYEEVNMYNFRTKVIKNSVFEPIEVILIDDDKNYSMEFLMNYIRETVPITNGYTNSRFFEESGMNFDRQPVYSDQYEFQTAVRQQNKDQFNQKITNVNANSDFELKMLDDQYKSDLKALATLRAKGIISGTEHENRLKDLQANYQQQKAAVKQQQQTETQFVTQEYTQTAESLGEISENIPKSQVGSASIGRLNNTAKTVLREIRLFHVYDRGTQMNVYHIHNPKILQVNMDEFNMEDSSGNYITLNIGYDAFDVNTSIPLHGISDNSLPTSNENLGVKYHLHDTTYVAPSAYQTGGAGGQTIQPLEESYDTQTEPEYSVTAPNGDQIYSNDGQNWFDKENSPIDPGTEYTVDGVTSTFTPPNVNGTDGYGVPTMDGQYVDLTSEGVFTQD